MTTGLVFKSPPAGRFVQVPSWLGNRLLPRRTLVQAVRLGPVLFLAIPGEVASETGQELERLAASQGWMPFILGYANDYIAYVIPHRYYGDQTRYEARASFYGPHLAEFMEQQVRHLLHRLGMTEEPARLNEREVERPTPRQNIFALGQRRPR